MKSMLFSLILMLCSGAVSAAEAVASVILSFGENVAVAADGSERVLKRHSEVYANDLLKTGPGGRLQLRFSDNSRLALKAATEFRIAEYQFEQKKPEEGKALFQLLKGGMRTISGQIGKPNKENYRLETTVATIGIRGTHYGVEYTGEGIYCETIEGAIQVTSDHQTILVSAGEGAWWGSNGNVRKGSATGQTGDYILRKKVQSDALTSDEQNEEPEDDSKLAGTIPATDPELEGDYSDDGRSGQPELPDPTGNGTRAPDGALVAVAFTRDDKAKGYLSGNGSVVAGSASGIAIDNSAGGLVTGISYKDNKPNTTPHACSPCIFTGGDDTGFVSGSGTATLGGAEISWGRWNAGFELKENNTVQTLAGGFHYMYSDSLTTQAQLDALTTARSGSYLYTFTNGSTSLTAPQIETGATGSLVGYGSGAVAPGRVYGGTYVLVNWDSLEIEQVSIKADVNDGTGIRSFNLTEAVDKQGVAVKTSLNDVLQGGELTLAGSCSGGQCSVGGNDTAMNGQMTFDLVGNRADGAISSYGASGSSPVNKDITVVGTVLLDSSGPAP
ncbi:FecR family protein [Amphritea atlantica]|uniref:FecR family protein n=1 Tax=Amphritea atlantica TaxID=355243 RepID=A0A1H9D4S5_9GAMM|nr:FecR family protein [Amphritea atlantica]SEQ08381.1 FecR family protein [Amphritea atlantica]